MSQTLGNKPKLHCGAEKYVHKITVAIIQAEQHIVEYGIYPEQRFKSYYKKHFMQPSNAEKEKIQNWRAVMPQEKIEHKV